MAATVWIGTSGWHYKHWVGNFYPERCPADRMLGLYVQQFNTVELNNTFYHLPEASSVECWRESTPDGFCFAVKGSRFITHMKKLKDPEQGLARFFERVDVLREKLGPILFQLPPNWQVDEGRFSDFLACLPTYHRYAFEFRNDTWNTPEIDRLLERANAAYCPWHLAGVHSPIKVTADFAYVRLHGPGGKYQGSYDDAALSVWAERIKNWRQQLRSVYLYFDNDDSGYAAGDAVRLKTMLGLT